VLFSNLVRNALDYSNQNFIPLEKEIEFLETYLKLEKLRFDDSFNYRIKCTITRDINIPSLIIQPFVENAIIHGLFHKKGQKNLNILFEQDNEQIFCKIMDNGIGRENAKAIQDRQGKTHESFALNSIKKRIDILSKQYGRHIGYSISDVNKNAEFTGTQVIVVLPYID
jgi:LytS/YehU family sensor histidine kinase